MLPFLLRLEELFDRGDRGTLTENDHDERKQPFARICEAAQQRDWSSVYEKCAAVFESHSGIIERSFALQWAVASTEMEYDLERRRHWLRKWAEIPGWAAEPYALYLWTFQSGLSAFFDGSLREAEARFKRSYELAKSFEYGRGQMRSLLHLGLVYRDLGDSAQASELLHSSLIVARTRQAKSMIERILVQIEKLGERVYRTNGQNDGQNNGGDLLLRFDVAKLEIERKIMNRDFEGARRLLIRTEIQRRNLGLTRKRESLFLFPPLLLLARGRPSAGNRLLSRISDPILKVKALEMKRALFELEEAERLELSNLRLVHGLSDSTQDQATGYDRAELCGIPLQSVLDTSIKALMTLLLSSIPPVTKEELCRLVWGLNYDPVVHDGKIYKLIHKTKLYFKTTDLILNCYGAYRLNPDYLPEKVHSSANRAS